MLDRCPFLLVEEALPPPMGLQPLQSEMDLSSMGSHLEPRRTLVAKLSLLRFVFNLHMKFNIASTLIVSYIRAWCTHNRPALLSNMD